MGGAMPSSGGTEAPTVVLVGLPDAAGAAEGMDQDRFQPEGPRPNWLKPRVEQHSLRQYLTTLRRRAWVVVLSVLVTTGAAAAYVATAEEVYEAEASVLVTPI